MLERRSAQIGIISSVSGSLLTAFLNPARPNEQPADDAQIGGLVRIATRTSTVYGIVHSLRMEHDSNHPEGEKRIAEIQLLGEVMAQRLGAAPSRFERGVSSYPSLGAPIFTTTQEDLKLVYAPPTTVTVRIGSLAQDSGVAAYVLTDELLGKHFASQRVKPWFDEDLFLGLMRLRGSECRAPGRYAEGFYGRKVML